MGAYNQQSSALAVNLATSNNGVDLTASYRAPLVDRAI